MLEILKQKGYNIDSIDQSVSIFEESIANYSKPSEYVESYAVCVNSLENSVELCLRYLNVTNQTITLPKNISNRIPNVLKKTDNIVEYERKEWAGIYNIGDTKIVDGTHRFHKKMYTSGTYHCISFDYTGIIKIGNGSIIISDDSEFIKFAKQYVNENNLGMTSTESVSYTHLTLPTIYSV